MIFEQKQKLNEIQQASTKNINKFNLPATATYVGEKVISDNNKEK